MNNKFDIKLVHDSCLNSLHDEDDVKMKEYLLGYEELDKFCNLMGVVFGFVSKDLRAKMEVLYEFLNNEKTSGNFETVKKMIEYEKDNQLLNKKGYTSGSRTLLRLHRGLNFIKAFLSSIGDLKDSDNTSAVCRAAYDQTLSNHHTFVIRNGARLAMHTMPTKEQLLVKVCGDNKEDIQSTLDLLPKMLETTTTVFDRIENLYTIHDLHALP